MIGIDDVNVLRKKYLAIIAGSVLLLIYHFVYFFTGGHSGGDLADATAFFVVSLTILILVDTIFIVTRGDSKFIRKFILFGVIPFCLIPFAGILFIGLLLFLPFSFYVINYITKKIDRLFNIETNPKPYLYVCVVSLSVLVFINGSDLIASQHRYVGFNNFELDEGSFKKIADNAFERVSPQEFLDIGTRSWYAFLFNDYKQTIDTRDEGHYPIEIKQDIISLCSKKFFSFAKTRQCVISANLIANFLSDIKKEYINKNIKVDILSNKIEICEMLPENTDKDDKKWCYEEYAETVPQCGYSGWLSRDCFQRINSTIENISQCDVLSDNDVKTTCIHSFVDNNKNDLQKVNKDACKLVSGDVKNYSGGSEQLFCNLIVSYRDKDSEICQPVSGYNLKSESDPQYSLIKSDLCACLAGGKEACDMFNQRLRYL